MAEKGIMVIEHADFEGIERLAAATGAEILSTFDAPDRSEKVLGFCESVYYFFNTLIFLIFVIEFLKIEETMIGEDKVIRFRGCKNNEACTIILRGASTHIVDEAERSLHDALCVLISTVKNRRVVYGGGNSEL
jgi:T-complex protein 1 subunit beta